MNDKHIPIEILYKKLEETLSTEEELQFQVWSSDSECQQYFEHLREYVQLKHEPECSEQELQHYWQGIRKRIRRRRQQQNRRRLYRKLTVAAAIVLTIVFSGNFFGPREERLETKATTNIIPGQRNAILELADGRTYDLKTPAALNRAEIGEHIRIDSNRLNYLKSDSLSVDHLVYNKLIVPRGGEYQILLEDGTKVWLNAETSLRYPENFVGDSREVYLEGEAYFEVAEDKHRPFVVHAGIQQLTVLGTRFAISNYQNDTYLQTTLVEGRVKVELTGQVYHLEPDEQITYNRNNNQVSRKKVDVREFIAWKDGKYVFSRKRLEEMLNTLSRWYDFQVVYQDASVKEKLFSGELMRFGSFDDILRIIGKSSDLNFTVRERIVIVSK